MTTATRQLVHVEAHTLINADRGVHIVASTPLTTYVGWFQLAREEEKGWTRIVLDDFTNVRCTLVVPSRSHVHIEPFTPLQVGSYVVRRGWDDSEHRNYHRRALGQVERTHVDSEGRRVFAVRWPDELDARWHTRQWLLEATPEILAWFGVRP